MESRNSRKPANLKSLSDGVMRMINGEIFEMENGVRLLYDPEMETGGPFRYIDAGKSYAMNDSWTAWKSWLIEVEESEPEFYPILCHVRNNTSEPWLKTLIVGFDKVLGYKSENGNYYSLFRIMTEAEALTLIKDKS